MKKQILTAGLFLLLSGSIIGQDYYVNSNVTPEQLVQHIAGSSVVTSNVTYKGAELSKGIFNGFSNIGMESGIILSSGKAVSSQGPNNNSSMSSIMNTSGDNDLQLMSGNSSGDASVLEFDFIPADSSFSLNIVLGSEEYPEYVNTQFVDEIGVFLSGPTITGPYSSPPDFPGGSINIALIPSLNLRIWMNNINNGMNNNGPCENCSYYVNNNSGEYIQYDGFTTVIPIGMTALIPGSNYHLKLAISDIMDRTYDSGLFIEAGSLVSSTKTELQPDIRVVTIGNQLMLHLPEGFDNCNIRITDLTGKTLYVSKANGLSFIHSIDSYQPGLYIITLWKEGKTCSFKLIL